MPYPLGRDAWLTPDILMEFIDIGRAGVEAIPPSIDEYGERRFPGWGNLSRDLLMDLVVDHDADDSENLIRGIILYGRKTGHGTGGSVSPIIPLYGRFVNKWREREPDLTAWIMEHRKNPYDPFGTYSPGKISNLNDYFCSKMIERQDSLERIALEEESQRIVKQQKAEQRRINSTHRLANAVKRGDLAAVQALIGHGAEVEKALPDGGSLVEYAEMHWRPSVAIYLKFAGIK